MFMFIHIAFSTENSTLTVHYIFTCYNNSLRKIILNKSLFIEDSSIMHIFNDIEF